MANVKICDMKSCKKIIKDDLIRQPVVIMGRCYDLCEQCTGHMREFIATRLGAGYPVLESIPLDLPGAWPANAPDLAPLYPDVHYTPVVITPVVTPPGQPLSPMPQAPRMFPLQDDTDSGRITWGSSSSTEYKISK